MIRKYTTNDTDDLIAILENADSAADPFLPKKRQRQSVRKHA